MPAKDDVFEGQASIADDGYHTIRPASGDEAVVTYINIDDGGEVIITRYDGTTEAIINDLSSGGDPLPFNGYGFPVTNSIYLRVQNVSGGALIIGHAGYYTKAAS